ncbi:hypothetical protein ACT4X1_12020 [Acinetobacter baumannii]|uniref:hypothetical protein n=1 Tax=Acinetobacter baumannii TaxID=470 RepID=UPI0002D064A9|nr:hypothetical protein [Acinetobacter baumannii]ENW45219.1 hypothetical protein F919_01427 [Acinetobacter baumannii NIPH 329]MDC4446567.1 hypothetical protein [Acinetobacter baumannii]MDC4612212.1 hypothetical protein [Acinetobacter baumannii]MDC5014008.1 hypothetical protein [Acinetobacter baumannii]MDC5023596.1 hypothetical protein [Acinetobacter baumannii]
MARRKLEDKIKRVGYFVGGGILVYLLISFFILSSFPWYQYLLDKKLAYDVFKDSLTIGAAFLAPIAAFVLFNDWRVEYHIKEQFNKIDEIKKIVQEVETTLSKYLNRIFKENVNYSIEFESFSERLILLEYRDLLAILLVEIDEKDQLATEFKKNVGMYYAKLNVALSHLHIMEFNAYREGKLIKDDIDRKTHTDEIQKIRDDFMERYLKFHEIHNELSSRYISIVTLGNEIKRNI